MKLQVYHLRSLSLSMIVTTSLEILAIILYIWKTQISWRSYIFQTTNVKSLGPNLLTLMSLHVACCWRHVVCGAQHVGVSLSLLVVMQCRSCINVAAKSRTIKGAWYQENLSSVLRFSYPFVSCSFLYDLWFGRINFVIWSSLSPLALGLSFLQKRACFSWKFAIYFFL